MKKIILSAALVILFSGIGFSQTIGDTVISNDQAKLKLKAYYFHITDRCHTCYSIEENLRETVFRHFNKELEKGIIDLYILNCEMPENQKLVKKYNAYGSTLVITPVKNGKELEHDELSAWAFKKAGNKDIFVRELKKKIKAHL